MRYEPATIIRWYIIAVISWIPIAEHLGRRHRGILVTPLPALPDHLLATPPVLQPMPPYYTGSRMSSQLRSRIPSTWSTRARARLPSERSQRSFRAPRTLPPDHPVPPLDQRSTPFGCFRGSCALSAVTAATSRNFRPLLMFSSYSHQ